MDLWRTLALAGAIGLVAGAGPAGAATIVLNQTPNALVGGSGGPLSYSGAFNVAPYLSDAQSRTFVVTAATLSLGAHSDPSYGPPTTSDSYTFTGIDYAAGQIDVLHTHTTTYTDTVADRLTLGAGGIAFGGQTIGGQTVSGQVSQILDTTQTADLGATDGPVTGSIFGLPPFFGSFPGVTQHTTNEDVTIDQAVYGPLDLSEALNAGLIQQMNFTGALDFAATPGSPGSGLPGFPGFPGVPGLIFPDGSQFDIDSVRLSFDLAQTGGPPPVAGVPEPAQWALMIAGFGLAGAGLRRRRSSAVAT